MSNLPHSGSSTSLDNVGVSREQFRVEIGQLLQYLAQALGGVPGTYGTQTVDPLAVLLAGAPKLAPGAAPLAADNSTRIPDTAWVRALLTSTTANYLPLTGGTIGGNVGNTGTGFLQLPQGTTAQRPATPAVGMARFNSSTGKAEVYQGGGWSEVGGGSSAAGEANLLINASFRINQRNYVSGAATTKANQYTLDRWRVDTLGQALAFSAAANITTATAPAGGISQVIEAVNVVDGQHVLSWEGTATAQVNGVAVTSGTPFNLAGGQAATVRFIGGTVLRPKLERGSSASSYAYQDYSAELLRCQRYYVTGPVPPVYNPAAPGSGASGYVSALISFPAQMRATPTVTCAAAALTYNYANAASLALYAVPNQWTAASSYTADAEL